MAYYAALVPLVQLLEDIIIHDRYPTFLLGKQSIMKSLHEKVNLLEESLQDYSSKGDEAGDRVEGRVRDVAGRAQGIIESEISNKIYPEEASQGVITIPQFDVELEKVGQDVDSIVEDLMLMKESQPNENLQPEDYSVATSAAEQTPTGLNTMVGFDESLNLIKDQLCGQSSQLRIIPIVGMGGIGKTTLARNTFDDALIVYHFDCRAWVTISQDYQLNRVLQSTLKSMRIVTDDLRGKEDEELKEHIYKYLKGRRYLIVVDDVWNTNVLDDMKCIFPNDNNGSRILLTTRLIDVAHYANNYGFLHEMQFMNVNASWNLLQNKVFAQKSCPPELEDVGRFIAGKCRGLPLAIVVVAGVLSNVRTLQHWIKVAQNVSSFLSIDDEHLSNVLSLSYNHLSHQLKACFLYMGGFPEDYIINISRLIRLWVAEGFLKSVGGFKTSEQVAKERLEDLVKRNLVLITKKRADGQFKKCTLHDVVRDFCRQRAVHECFFEEMDHELYSGTPGAGSAGYIILPLNTRYELGEFGTRRYVCTILWFDEWILSKWDKYKLLKTLDISDKELCFDISVVAWMFHLKYLALRLGMGRLIDCFPPLILKYCNLQTLVIIYNTFLYSMSMPYEFWQMPRVRHVIIDRMSLPAVPAMVDDVSVRILEDLQTLGTICDFKFTNEAVKMIPNLRKLKICSVRTNSDMWETYGLNHLVHLRQLVELNIIFRGDLISIRPFPNSFVFPQNLEKLSLKGCQLPQNDLTVVGSLPCLQVLKLRNGALVGEEWEPIQGQFPRLQFLLIERLSLKRWRAEDTHFPRLKHLKIIKCNRLEKIPLEIGNIPTLESITVVDSSSGAKESAGLIREEQLNQGNDTLQVLVHNDEMTIFFPEWRELFLF